MTEIEEKDRERKRRIAALSLSCVPGAGHMFLGRIGKGFALMCLMVFSIFFITLYADALGAYWVVAYLVPTVSLIFLCYSIFDVKSILQSEREGRAAGEDPLMAEIEKRVLFNPRAIGFALVTAGLTGALDWLSTPIGHFLRENLSVDLPLGALVLPIILLGTGLYLILKKRG